MARLSWTKEQVVSVLNFLAEDDTHQLFKNKKRSNQMDEWYDMVGARVGVTGSKIRDLIKNLGKEFRAVKQKMLISGEGTDEKCLKNSTEIYEKYEIYLNLYYPKGSSVIPESVVTESGEKKLPLNSDIPSDGEMDQSTSGTSSKRKLRSYIYFRFCINHKLKYRLNTNVTVLQIK